MGEPQKLQTLEDALRRLAVVNSLYGLRVIEFPRGRQRRFVTLFYLLIIAGLCSLMFHWLPEEEIDIEYRESGFVRVFYDITMFMDIAVILCYTFIGSYRSAMYDGCVRKLTKVDRTLESLGSPTNYEKIRTQVTCAVIGWFVFIICVFVASVWWLNNTKPFWSAFWISFVYSFSLDISGMADITFMFIVKSLGQRFERINQLLRAECGRIKNFSTNRINDVTNNEQSSQTSVHEPYMIIENGHNPAVLQKKCLIHTTRLLHYELRQASKMTSTVFGIQMAMEMASSLLIMTGVIYSLYYTVLKTDPTSTFFTIDIVMKCSFVTIYATKILIVNMTCGKTAYKANKTVDLCFEMAFLMEDQEIKEEIQQFGMEAKRVRFQFTAFGAFTLDCRIFRSVIGTVITYLLILLQMS